MKINYSTEPKKEIAKIFLFVCLIVLSLDILLETIIIVRNNRTIKNTQPKFGYYCVMSIRYDGNNQNNSLKHLHAVFVKIGYEKKIDTSDCCLLWLQNSPFVPLEYFYRNIKRYQTVNLFPGDNFLTSEILLAPSKSKYTTKSFTLPRLKNTFSKSDMESMNTFFLDMKPNNGDISVKNDKNSIQEHIRPFLVDGHTFIIGVYVVITSVNPLRAYWYKGDVWFRFCATKYFPVDEIPIRICNNTASYLTTWEIPSLYYYYSMLAHGMKDSFDLYVRSEHKDPSVMWLEIQEVIAEQLLKEEHYILTAMKTYPSPSNIFEMLRFDLMVDENLRVYSLKAVRSPDLDEVNFFHREYQLFYEQLLYNLLLLTGVSRKMTSADENMPTHNMVYSEKHIEVFEIEGINKCREDCGALEICQLCGHCLNKTLKKSLLDAQDENIHRGDFRRLVPLAMNVLEDTNILRHLMPKDLSKVNRLQHLWYQGKCNKDIAWCT